MLYLPEGEFHEMGLLFADYLIRSRQGKTYYLSQSIPMNDLRLIADVHQPDYLFTMITTSPGPSLIQKYINKLAVKFPNINILITGTQVIGQDLETPPNVQIINQIEELLGIIEDKELHEA